MIDFQILHLASSAASIATDPAAPAVGSELARLIIEWGPIGIFLAFVVSGVGLHITEDFILLPAGYFAYEAHDGVGWFVRAGIAGYLGIVVGDMLWVWLCGKYGSRLLHTKWFLRMIHPRRLLEVKHQMDERGAWAVVVARFIPGTRTPVLTMAGMLHMPWWKFFAAELPTTAITVPVQMLVGVGIAKLGEGVENTAHKVIIIVGASLAVLLLSVALHKWLSHRAKRVRAPRTRASWLRVFRLPLKARLRR